MEGNTHERHKDGMEDGVDGRREWTTWVAARKGEGTH
jgi:hypothetical protein